MTDELNTQDAPVVEPVAKVDFNATQVYADVASWIDQHGAEGSARMYQILEEMRDLFNR
jgi:ferritin